MNDVINAMLGDYQCQTQQDYQNSLKEIIQNIALLGLWRAKFFEHAAFYGGSALRILYGLDRFSEDLDFSLLTQNPEFKLKKYCNAIRIELASFGFEVEVDDKIKSFRTHIQSAFIKANTKKQMITIHAPVMFVNVLPMQQQLKVKIEVDIDPPSDFKTEAKFLFQPIPFSINTFQQPDLFAGKIHALLCRQWNTRVKGRDWFDLVWYVGKKIPLHLLHLKARLAQTGLFEKTVSLDLNQVKEMLYEKVNHLNFQQAKRDILPFIKNSASISLWSQNFFKEVISRLTAV